MRDCKRAERYATQPFGAGDNEDIALETEVRRAYQFILHKVIDRRQRRPATESSAEGPGPSRRRAGVASTASPSTRRFSARREILISTQDYFKCFLLQGAVYRGLDALDPIIDANDL